jgi:cobalt-zinc-cadmium efflux system protein
MSQAHIHAIKGRRFVVSIVLTGLIFMAEFGGGLWTGSLALLSDSAHVFMDIFALGLSYLALRAAALPPNDNHTYGYHRLQVLAALANGATLLLIAFEILREAWGRFLHPERILAGPMLVIAAVGLIVNLIVAFTLRQHDHQDLNTRAAFLHVLGDALASVGVIGVGLILLFVNWAWLDPLVSVLIGMLILLSSGRVLKESIHILAEGMPAGMSASAVAETMRHVPGVKEVHDLHVWTVAPGYNALSAHIIIADRALSQTAEIMSALKKALHESFAIQHTTIQLECKNCGQGTVACAKLAGEPIPFLQQ